MNQFPKTKTKGKRIKTLCTLSVHLFLILSYNDSFSSTSTFTTRWLGAAFVDRYTL